MNEIIFMNVFSGWILGMFTAFGIRSFVYWYVNREAEGEG